MEIREYDHVDPLQVLHLNMLALGFSLSPEHAAHIRRTDPRPFPFLAVYAVEEERVLGQVGVFRLPMISKEGREDVGGVWAVSTHPQYAGRGIASLLLDEAHARMRAAGLRFSTLGTDRFRTAHKLYRQHGYEDMQVWATGMAPWEVAHQPTRLRAELPGPGGYELVENVFEMVSGDYLGFAWRHRPFSRLRDKVSPEEMWVLWKNEHRVGFALAHADNAILKISNVVTGPGIEIVEAVAAVVAQVKARYVQVQASRPSELDSLRKAGYHVAHPDWSAFMVKALTPECTVEDARYLYGIGTDQFLISWLDTT